MKMIQINSLASYLSMESPDNICLPSLIFHESDKETRGKMTTSFFLPNHCTTPMQWSTGKEKKRKEKKRKSGVGLLGCFVSQNWKKKSKTFTFSFPALFLATKHNYRKHQQEVKNPTNEKPGAMKYLKRPMFGGLETKNLHGKGKRKWEKTRDRWLEKKTRVSSCNKTWLRREFSVDNREVI